MEDNLSDTLYSPEIEKSETYINANGEEILSVKLGQTYQGPPEDNRNTSHNHDYSLVVLEKPWKVVPIISDNEIIEINPSGGKIIYIPQREKVVMKALQDPKITERLYACSDVEIRFPGKREDYDTEERFLARPYMCFNGSMFIAGLWMLDNPIDETISTDDAERRVYGQFEDVSPYQLKFMYGTFLFDISNSLEDHGFVLYMTADKIKIYNSYGGCLGFYTKEFNRRKWIDMFVNFNQFSPQEKADAYIELWGFPKEWKNTVISIENLERIVFEKVTVVRIW